MCAVIDNHCFIGSAVVFGRAGRGEAPFDKGRAADEGDVVEVDYLPSISGICLRAVELVCIPSIQAQTWAACMHFNSALDPLSARGNLPSYSSGLRQC